MHNHVPQRAETYLIIGFGKGVESGDARNALQSLACEGKGIFASGTLLVILDLDPAPL
jgi:hypothetical protein